MIKWKKSKKTLTLLLAFLIAFTYMPFGVGVQEADATSGVTGSFKEGRVLESADGSTFKYSGNDAGWMQIYFVSYGRGGGFKVGPAKEVSPIRAYRVNGDVAYCLEHGVMADETVKLTGRSSDKSYLEGIYENEGLRYILNNMSLCLLYGRQSGRSIGMLENTLGFKDSDYYGRNAKSYSLDDWEVATRQLIHESQQRFRDDKFNKKSSNGLYFEDYWYKGVSNPGNGNGKKISQSHYRKPLEGTGAVGIYDYMARLIKDHLQLSMKMGSYDDKKPKELKLTQGDDGKWYSRKIPITKKEAIAVKMVKDNGDEYKNYHIELLSEGNSYYYQYVMDSEPNWDKTYTVKKQISYFKQVPDDMLIWECKDGSGGHVQALATGACDPISRYVKFTKDDTPEPEPSEPPEPEYFPQIQISVEKEDLNPGFDGDTHTGMGDASLAATYVLLRDGVEVDRITLDEYGNRQTLSDTPWPDALALTKTGSGTTSRHMVGNPPSDHCGTDGPTRYDWDGEVTYEVKEIRPDGRFIEPDSGKRSMTVTYNAFTRDTRSYACQTPNWTDIVYTVKTTQTDGITFSDQNGTIDAVEDPIYADADTFINDCYRGKLTLSKSLENSDVFSERKSGTVGGEKDSTKSRWKMKLNSSGWESHPYVRFVREADLADGTSVYRVVRDTSGESNETTDMEIGTNGDLYIYDIPYGEYTLTEVSADDESFVKESCQVNIQEHDKPYTVTDKNDDRYDYNVRDKKKTNIIKVIKTNAETGKIVPAAGTKFYLRYMGDPLLSDPTKAKNYGRLLPNAEDITKKGPYTWECDENGEIAIPYELEWGIYRIEEWLLPEGYFVGEYGGGDTAKNHDYGIIEEGQQKALAGHGYSDVVGIFDETGKAVKYKEKDSYKLNEVFNFYTFKVEKQDDHADGNFAHKVTADKDISKADEQYDSADYPYTNYYKAVAMPNNMVKGKIEIKKDGEVLTGFKEERKDGKKVFTPIYEMGAALKDAVFNIYAAIDTWLNDGNDGPDIYDSNTDDKITIPKTKSTNVSNLFETIVSTLSKFFKGTGDIYETGEMLHNSGGKLWYLKDRAAKEDGRYTRVYVSPEQKDTKYSYSYEKEEAGFKYRYDVTVNMNYKANGDAVTDVEVTKVTSTASGYSLTLPETKPQGSVGEHTFSPIESYLAKEDPTDTRKASSLSVSEKSYTYELLGGKDTDISGNEVDLSDIGVSAYEEKDYKAYILTAEDVKEEERVVTPAQDADGDGVFEIPEVKETKTSYEWKNNCELAKKIKGEKAVVKVGDDFAVETIGYYQAGEYVSENSMVHSDEAGNPIPTYTIPEGYSLIPFTGDPEEEVHHIIISKPGEEGSVYQILLSDGTTWQECDSEGNFKKMFVQKFTAKYEQVSGDNNGFTFSWDGFTVDAKASAADKNVVVKITKPESKITPVYEIGAGYTYSEEGNTVTFTGTEPTSPIYFLSKDGIKTEMYYAGGTMKTILTLPQIAVDKNYQYIVPTLNFKEDGKDNIIDWYKALSPDNPTTEGTPIPGVGWKAERIESGKTGEAESYRIEIVSNQTADNPMEITFADGYTMTMFSDTAESGNGVGVIVLDNIYKTNRASLGQLVDTITTGEDGKTVSKLLPLGKYIIREVSAPSGYVAEDKGYEVELSYKDQFTPLVWETLNLENKYFTVEIDLEKVFETAFESGNYAAGSGATFGLYNTEEIKAGKESLKKDTLMDVIKVDDKGKALSKIKLPFGVYYIKELATKSGYTFSDIPFYFAVGEGKEITSEKCTFGTEDTEKGVTGEIIANGFNRAKVTINTEVRYPMPDITIDGIAYALTEDVKTDMITITADKEIAKVEADITGEKGVSMILPNGKTLTVSVSGNTFTYTYDGVTKTFIPKVSYTGYSGVFSADFTPTKGESLAVITDRIMVTEPGTAADRLTAEVTRTPLSKEEIVTPAVPRNDINGDGIIDPALGETEEVPAVTKQVGILDKDGNQTYTQAAKVKYVNIAGENVIASTIIREKDGKTLEEPLSESKEILLSAGDIVSFKTESGAGVRVMLDKSGTLKTIINHTLTGQLGESDSMLASVNGANKSDEITFVKSVTLARQDSKSDTLKIKINTTDNLNVSPIKNDKVKPDTPPTPPNSTNPAIRTIAKDSKTNDHIALAGKDVTIVDTVYFYNLTIGQEYKLVGKLMDKETGKPVVIHGKEVTAEITFKPAISTGTQDVSFTFDARTLKGKDVVVFETLFKIAADKDGKVTEEKVTSHEDINDEGQTITFPEIHTTATGENGEKTIEAKGTAIIIDTVRYEHLIAGKTYTMKGYLVDKKTGKAIYENGEKVTSEVTFVAEDTSGTVEMVFTVNAKALSSKSVVVFEDCYFEDIKVGTHADINDEGQTVKFKAKDGRIEFDTERDVDDDGDVDIVPSVPKTGDRMQLQPMLLLMIASIFGLLASIRIRRKE